MEKILDWPSVHDSAIESYPVVLKHTFYQFMALKGIKKELSTVSWEMCRWAMWRVECGDFGNSTQTPADYFSSIGERTINLALVRHHVRDIESGRASSGVVSSAYKTGKVWNYVADLNNTYAQALDEIILPSDSLTHPKFYVGEKNIVHRKEAASIVADRYQRISGQVLLPFYTEA